jgi:hypothetical protein
MRWGQEEKEVSAVTRRVSVTPDEMGAGRERGECCHEVGVGDV